MNIYAMISDPGSRYSVMFEDDGKVAYAYLFNAGGKIVSDVWLYNRVGNVEEPDWRDKTNLPFINPTAYAVDHAGFSPIDDASEVTVNWGSSHPFMPRVCLRGNLFAILREGAKPGWSRMARKDGPLALVLDRKKLS